MKRIKYVIILILMICSEVLVSCGSKNSSVRDYYVINAESELLFSSAKSSETEIYLGTQYCNGQAVQVWAEKKISESSEATLDVFILTADGNKESVLRGVSEEYQRRNWYIGAEGAYFVWSLGYLVRLDEAGKEVFQRNLKGSIRDICQLSDGRVILLVKDTEKNKMKLSEIDIKTGEIDDAKSIYLDENEMQYISNKENDLLLMNAKGIYKVNLKDGTKTDIFPFIGSKFELYESTVSDFYFTGEGNAEILRNLVLQKISRENIAETKKVLIVRDTRPNRILEDCIVQFNKENDEYYIILESLENDFTSEELSNYKQQTNLQLVSGVGADIIFTSAMSDTNALFEKGVFENLSPYIQNSGIKEDEFFPITFEYLKENDNIYTVHAYVQPIDNMVTEELLGNRETPDIETFVNAFLDYKKEEVFYIAWESEQILDYFLCGSENLWGMINWDENKCDFSCELFSNMLKVSQKYGWNKESNAPSIAAPRQLVNMYQYESYAKLESEGMVSIGWMFDDGSHITINESNAMVINSNSHYKDGAWEFICYLLGEGQAKITYINSEYPVNIEAYNKLIEKEIEEGSLVRDTLNGKSVIQTKGGSTVWAELGYDDAAYKAIYDMTEERGAEIKGCLEDARLRPTSIKPILEIVCEDAKAYFYGDKSIEEVVKIIENRVQLYLDENY